MPKHLKSLIYEAVVHTVALYGTECWPSLKTAKQPCDVVEMRMLPWSL